MIINASIDLNKIDKTKIVTTDKNGQPFKNGAKYYNITIFVNDQPDQFGNDSSIAANQSKEEREAGDKRVYLGNGKIVGGKPAAPAPAAAQQAPSADDDLPF